MSSDLTMPNRPLLLFDHVPKCAGTSVLALLEHLYTPQRIAPFSQFHTASACLRHFVNYDVVCGHFSREVLFTTPFPLKRISVVRDPIDRIVSHYYYLQAQQAAAPRRSSLPKSDIIERMSFDEFVSSSVQGVAGVVENYYCIHFADALRQITSSAELLPTALEAMERYDLVGLHENLPETARRICRLVGAAPTDMPAMNLNANRPKLDELEPKTLELISRRNALDVEFYKRTQDRFYKPGTDTEIGPLITAPPSCFRAPKDFGFRSVRFEDVKLDRGDEIATYAPGETLELSFTVESDISEPNLGLALVIKDVFDDIVYGMDSNSRGAPLAICAGDQMRGRLSLPLKLGPGDYSISLVAYPGKRPASKDYYHWREEALRFRVNPASDFFGQVRLDARLEFN